MDGSLGSDTPTKGVIVLTRVHCSRAWLSDVAASLSAQASYSLDSRVVVAGL